MDGVYSIRLRTRLGTGFAIFSPRKADLNVKSFTLIPHQSTTASCINTFLVLHFNSSVDENHGDFSCCIFHNVKHLSSAEEACLKHSQRKFAQHWQALFHLIWLKAGCIVQKDSFFTEYRTRMHSCACFMIFLFLIIG